MRASASSGREAACTIIYDIDSGGWLTMLHRRGVREQGSTPASQSTGSTSAAAELAPTPKFSCEGNGGGRNSYDR